MLAGSSADAEDSAAHIAEMVRRSTERLAAPGPSPAARPDVTPARRPPTPTASVGPPLAPPLDPVAQPVAQPVAGPARPTTPQPSRRTLFAAVAFGAVTALLIGGVVAMSHPVGSEGAPTSPTHRISPASAPAGYAVQVTDVITDCATHARGQVRDPAVEIADGEEGLGRGGRIGQAGPGR